MSHRPTHRNLPLRSPRPSILPIPSAMNDPPPAMNITNIRVIGVIGAGQMGSGIAQVAAQCGFRTLLTDMSADIAARAKEKIGVILGKQVAKGKLSDSARG